jgi:AhpD family alkylhydroperoxidase
MNKRISINELQPEAYKAMFALEAYSKSTEVSPQIKELIKIRASQINKCAYCLDMHTEDAIKLGETARRIYLLSAWKESHLFTEEEKNNIQTKQIEFISKRY